MGLITWSDHAPVSITIGDVAFATKANRWHFNAKLLADKETSSEILSLLTEFFKLNDSTAMCPFILWSAHKAYMRGILMSKGASVRKQRQQQLDRILASIKSLDLENKAKPSPIISAKLC